MESSRLSDHAESAATIRFAQSAKSTKAAHSSSLHIPVGHGEMSERILAFDWKQTPLGPIDSWSPSLKTTVSILLANRFPLLLWWGPEYISIYNDAYTPILGSKHPWALGTPVATCWAEIWDVLKPLIDTPFTGGPATWMDDIELHIKRKGFEEETHFTVAYSAVPDESAPRGIGGVLATVNEITEKVIGERRLEILRKLGERSAVAKTTEQACEYSTQVLDEHTKDIPFSLIYLVDADRKTAKLAGASGFTGVDLTELSSLPLDAMGAGPFNLQFGSSELRVLDDLPKHLAAIPNGPWPDAPSTAAVLPIPSSVGQPAVFLISGLSARISFDDRYRSFLTLVASQIATTIANARAREEERKRAEALAEIDRAKTAFFSNVSHEFRTPLALMLTPLEDLLTQIDGDSSEGRALALIHRNGQRLLKLVNTLLDFSRIEAGRIKAVYEPVDLAAYTRELASVFRSAIEKAGLAFEVDCEPLDSPIYVDRDMWEKIVLNLLSNAFKFTFKGKIAVDLRQEDEHVALAVRDTGTGIPDSEIPKLFERFYRVEGAEGRTHEGTGIGLAMVRELVHLHGGAVKAESQLGAGSTFKVTIPRGSSHLAADRIGPRRALTPNPLGAAQFVTEALRWIDDGASNDASAIAHQSREIDGATKSATVIVADDNVDMREYVARLLAPYYRVIAVADGEEAFNAAVDHRPDLIVSDVMMPKLDGFGLLQKLRAKLKTRALPIILLSARAGEESRIEGLRAGADDYLIKPFSTRELLARVEAALKLSHVRRAGEEKLTNTLESISDSFVTLDREWRFTYLNSAAEKSLGHPGRELLGRRVWDVFPHIAETEMDLAMRRAVHEGTLQHVEIYDERLGVWFHNRIYPIADGGLSIYFADVTQRKQSEEEARRRSAQFEALIENSPIGVFLVDADFKIREMNPLARSVFGDLADLIGRDFEPVVRRLLLGDYGEEVIARFKHTLETGESYATPEHPVDRRDRGSTEYVEWRIDRIPLPDGRHGVVCYFRDISAHVVARGELIEQRESLKLLHRQKDYFLATLAHELRNPLAPIRNAAEILARIMSSDPRAHQAIGIVRRQVTQMSRLVDDLLDVARITQGRVELKLERISLDVIIRQAIETVYPLIREKKHHLEVESEPASLYVEVDLVRLVQCMANILTNAAKYTDVGGRISVRSINDGAFAVIEVTDNGVGIAPELLPHVFDIFVQSEQTLDRALGGLGIGLSLVKELVHLHGGTVSAQSDGTGRGSTFAIRLPLSDVN